MRPAAMHGIKIEQVSKRCSIAGRVIDVHHASRGICEGRAKRKAAHAAEYDLIVNGIKNETDLGEQVNLVEQMIAQECALRSGDGFRGG